MGGSNLNTISTQSIGVYEFGTLDGRNSGAGVIFGNIRDSFSGITFVYMIPFAWKSSRS